MNELQYIGYFIKQIKKFEEPFLSGDIFVIDTFYDDGDMDATFTYHVKDVEGFMRIDHFFEKELRDHLNEELDREWSVRTDLINRISDDLCLYHTTITNC